MADTAENDQYSIHVVGVDLDHPLTFGAVHNAVVFRDPEGEAIFTIQGIAVNRETGEAQSFAIDPQANTLRAFAHDKEVLLTDGEPATDIMIFEGSAIEVGEKLLQMLEAADFMNDQNLAYVFADIVQDSQNSNSVVRTLVEAAGLEYTPELESVFAPGDGRILLPNGWEPSVSIEGMEAEGLTAVEVNQRIRTIVSEMEQHKIIEQAKQDPAPEATDADSLYYYRNEGQGGAQAETVDASSEATFGFGPGNSR